MAYSIDFITIIRNFIIRSFLPLTLLFFLKKEFYTHYIKIGFNTVSAKTILPSIGFWLIHTVLMYVWVSVAQKFVQWYLFTLKKLKYKM